VLLIHSHLISDEPYGRVSVTI